MSIYSRTKKIRRVHRIFYYFYYYYFIRIFYINRSDWYLVHCSPVGVLKIMRYHTASYYEENKSMNLVQNNVLELDQTIFCSIWYFLFIHIDFPYLHSNSTICDHGTTDGISEGTSYRNVLTRSRPTADCCTSWCTCFDRRTSCPTSTRKSLTDHKVIEINCLKTAAAHPYS